MSQMLYNIHKGKNVLFSYRLTWLILDKGPSDGLLLLPRLVCIAWNAGYCHRYRVVVWCRCMSVY